MFSEIPAFTNALCRAGAGAQVEHCRTEAGAIAQGWSTVYGWGYSSGVNTSVACVKPWLQTLVFPLPPKKAPVPVEPMSSCFVFSQSLIEILLPLQAFASASLPSWQIIMLIISKQGICKSPPLEVPRRVPLKPANLPESLVLPGEEQSCSW